MSNDGDTEYDSLNATYQNYEAIHCHSNSEYDTLNKAYQNYKVTHSYSNSEYDDLKVSETHLMT